MGSGLYSLVKNNSEGQAQQKSNLYLKVTQFSGTGQWECSVLELLIDILGDKINASL